MKHAKKNYSNCAIMVMSAVMIATLLVNMALCYLVDNKKRDNVYALGNVRISIDEEHFPEDPDDRIMVPMSIIPKDPKVVNSGSTNEYVFLKVTVPLCNVKIVDTHTNKIDSSGMAYREIFNFTSNDDAYQMVSGQVFTHNDTGNFRHHSDWILIDSSENLTEYTHSYLFGYSALLTSGISNSTPTLFDKVQLRNILEGELPTDTVQTIRIEAYAIQSEELMNDITVADTAHVTQSELTSIFGLYQRQEG